MKKLSFIAIILLIFSIKTNSQVIDEGVTFSQTYAYGTARSSAMGGAFTALGGDFGAISLNPASTAVFRSGSLVFSPELVFTSGTGKILNSGFDDTNPESIGNEADFKLANFGLVFSRELSGPVKYLNFAIGYNRINDFTNEIYLQGRSDRSVLDYFIRDANDSIAPWDLNPFGSKLAFDITPRFLIDTLDNFPEPFQYSSVSEGIDEIGVINTALREGHVSDWNFSFGFNVEHKLYIGTSFGVKKLYYHTFIEHNEQFVDNNGFNVDLFYNTDVVVDGTGYDFNLGVIYKPIEMLRMGAAFHSPTFYNMVEDYTSWLRNDDAGATEYPTDANGLPVYGYSDYKLRTPMKVTGGLAVLFGKTGILSVDADYLNYKNLDYNNVIGANPDTTINQILQPAYNLRAGGEVRLGPVSVRAGYAYYGSPYTDFDYSKHRISAGLGFNVGSMVLDFAAVQSIQQDSYTLIDKYKYNTNEIGELYSDLDFMKTQIIATIGFKF